MGSIFDPGLSNIFNAAPGGVSSQGLQDQSRANTTWAKTPDPSRPGFYTDGTAIPGSSSSPANVALQNAPGASGDAGWQGVYQGMQANNPNYTSPPSTLGSLMHGTPSVGSVSDSSTRNPYTVTGDPASAFPQSAGGTLGSLSGGIANPSTPNYPLNVNSYLNPSMDFTMNQGLKALGNTYGAQGNFLSGPAMKGITDYSQGVASQNWNNAAQIAAGQQAFGYGVNNNDRNFAYNAALNDQTIPFNQQYQLAQLGLGAANIGANQNNAQAAIQSNNILSGAQAGATGQIGQGNALSNAISQMIANYMGGQYMNKIFPQTGP